LLIVLMLANQVQASQPAPPGAAAGKPAANAAAALAAHPAVASLEADLMSEGFRVEPRILGAENSETGLRVSLLGIETTQPHPEIGLSAEPWDAAVPLAVSVVEHDGAVAATVEIRLRPIAGAGVEFAYELRPAGAADLRVRVFETLGDGEPRRRVEFFGAQADGTFAPLLRDAEGQAVFPSGELFVRGGFYDCMWNCFLTLNEPISWSQGFCLAMFLIAGGLAAAGTAGAAIGPIVVTALKACGLTFLIARAAALSLCLIQCTVG
jgi:hypothetical protein